MLHATKALYVTRGQGLQQLLHDSNGEQLLNKMIIEKEQQKEIDETLMLNIRDEYQRYVFFYFVSFRPFRSL